MNVNEFLIHFKEDLPKRTQSWSYDDYVKWQPEFYKKTKAFHRSAKKSYFEQLNRIASGKFNEYSKDLAEFAYLGLFTNEDEIEFSNLINKASENLTQIENELEMEAALNFLYCFTDFLLHEIQQGPKLSAALKELKNTIIQTREFDTDQNGELVIRFMDLIIGNGN